MAKVCKAEQEWSDLSSSIDLFLVQHEQKYDDARYRITKSHWIEDKKRKHCFNEKCRIAFSLTERKHHCRRCGEIFCNKCTSYMQRLSLLAQRDLYGMLYKVCVICFNTNNTQSFGKTTQHFNVFQQYRQKYKEHKQCVLLENQDMVDGDTTKISQRLENIAKKFSDYLNGNNKVLNMTELVKSSIMIPSWQIPHSGLKTSKTCFLCTKRFSLLGMCHHCRVCGETVCINCSSEELLVYMKEEDHTVDWCIIGTSSCPSQPPKTRDCLRLCTSCHSHAIHVKIQKILKSEEAEKNKVIINVEKYHNQLGNLKEKIRNILEKYQEIVNAIEHEKSLKTILKDGESTTKVLAKFNCDISDLFTQFAIDMQGFKKVRPKSGGQMKLFTSIINSMHQFYSQNFLGFRTLQLTLDNTLGHRDLEQVQNIVDYQAINCTFLVLKQLGLECLQFCNKKQLESTVPSIIATCEDICKKDLHKTVQFSGEDWEQHLESIQSFLKLRMKENKLIINGRKENIDFQKWLMKKCHSNLMRIERQLIAKSRENKFCSTKDALRIACLETE